VALSNK